MKKPINEALEAIMSGETSKPAKRPGKPVPNFEKYKGRTVTIACRVPAEEKKRLQRIFRQHEGGTLASGLKKALYEYLERRGWND